jgi:hypothetical protein
VIPVSGSAIDAYSRCLRKYFYAHDLGLERAVTSESIALGRAGHALLMPYYRALHAGADHPQAMAMAEAAARFGDLELDTDSRNPPPVARALDLVRLYWAVHASDAVLFEVLEVEVAHRVDMGGWTYAWTTDLLLADRQTGELVLLDHRFLGDPYDPHLLYIDPQLPRYAIGYAAAGRRIGLAWRNQIITHKGWYKSEPLRRIRREPVDVSPARLERARVELLLGAQRVLAWRELPVEVRRQTATRSWDPLSCRYCPFRKPCAVEARGEDATEILETEFRKSSYGYSDGEEAA